ncbi:MAG: nucleotide exchange factor GrpE [Candidatus Magasanikbacteria bacterium RIFOXYD2_FULL_39_9]|uniref:Protein GrpE n=1 Tax=Candidatus Magasanikbacteria bacterium RIFOXYD1_FULL_40_23 TaxID=1798705 RepID=A0A1F6PAI2_9BACT|nr:MAG: nucleotide exchange factor GrpE [Candidatus Magasanikbacteria bacterium RIFOXYD2_FULL_39_9]OGH93187.1 MAG: nucleotide exchange factor GrpE [Candidatus Magasanikbacteria bacterium RIFOXYD1_FULL_40_23]
MSEDNNVQDENKEQEEVKSSTCENCDKHKAEAEEYKTGWQRALADYKNLQKESADMRGVWAKASEQYILEEFVPVYENFKKAFAHKDSMAEENGWKQWADGIGHIKKQFGDILKNYQVEEIKTVGEKFDPRFHEAIGEEESEGSEPGTILKEVEGGYKRGDKVIKPARVIVSK